MAKALSNAFQRRIQLDNAVVWTPEGLAQVIDRSLVTMAFDNLSIFDARDTPLTPRYIVEKILIKGQGGLCYELNYLLNRVLRENGVATTLVTGTIFDDEAKDWFTFTDTHVLNIVELNGERYLADIGFGLRSPRTLVPLDGSVVGFDETQYLVTRDDKFNYLNFKKRGEAEWTLGYRFAIDYREASMDALERSRRIMTFEEASPFNKNPLIALFTAEGSQVLTATSCTVVDGKGKTKRAITREEFDAMTREMARPGR
ncbi:arylamine N-acetyltransferase [Metapseudomonas resinovorans]|uniref:Arylamine N-acetyltransferase n=1 Tax=Metapseudomonas resinovorans NBRC 106553 TaxID=1245471 RepID=S6AS78_METRE|nr:arylamine N-acetyltransferase [Pseudomonas resinovorans]BAN48873.1 hypothetical protein PCA10_31410 [Pseudomonas resinovorans NBRC 106553]